MIHPTVTRASVIAVQKRVAPVAFKENNVPPLKDPQPGSHGTPDAEDTLIGDWDPYVASIVESAQDQQPSAAPDRVPPAQATRAPSGSVSRRAQLLSNPND